jgi:3-deoxy-manno-octulosonate cytidylyltransferase (CMP-KDO synthetase)
MRAVAVIPARMDSERVPGKVLVDVDGEPLVVHVWRRAKAARTIDEAYVATDSQQIASAVQAAGGAVLWTEGSYQCGTDRVAHAVRDVVADIVVNVQADCAYLEPHIVDQTVAALIDSELDVATPIAAFPSDRDPADVSVVKVVVSEQNRAIYFSRRPIPHDGPWKQHIGVYGFKREALMRFAAWPPGTLECSERLEQLRILENGDSIVAVHVEASGISVDCPEDLARLSSLSHDSQTNHSRL